MSEERPTKNRSASCHEVRRYTCNELILQDVASGHKLIK